MKLFTIVDLNSLYLDVCKDRLYLEPIDSHTRRSSFSRSRFSRSSCTPRMPHRSLLPLCSASQTVMMELLRTITKAIAPFGTKLQACSSTLRAIHSLLWVLQPVTRPKTFSSSLQRPFSACLVPLRMPILRAFKVCLLMAGWNPMRSGSSPSSLNALKRYAQFCANTCAGH